MKFDFQSDVPDLVRHMREISEKAMPSESAKALNRTITFGRNEIAAHVSAQTGIPKALLKRRIKQMKGRRASPKNLKTSAFLGEATIPVSKLKPKPRRSGVGVNYKTITGQPINPKAFFATLKSGKKTAWVRKNSARKSLREVQVRVAPLMRRARRRIWGGPGKKFYEKTLFENMEKRIDKDLTKRGLRKT